jgi:hypothetical protein
MYLFLFGAKCRADDFETVAAMAAVVLSQKFRGKFIVHQRLNWEHHVKFLIWEGQFKKMYGIMHTSFNKLLYMILPWLQVNARQSSNASKGKRPIIAELILHCTLHYLAGGSFDDIHTCAGMSTGSFY